MFYLVFLLGVTAVLGHLVSGKNHRQRLADQSVAQMGRDRASDQRQITVLYGVNYSIRDIEVQYNIKHNSSTLSHYVTVSLNPRVIFLVSPIV